MLKRLSLMGIMVASSLFSTAPVFASDTIVIGTYPANPPWEYKTASGDFEGFEVDVVREVAKRLRTDAGFSGHGLPGLVCGNKFRAHRLRHFVDLDHQ